MIAGDYVETGGNITQLKAVAARAPRNVELSLGYGIGRLAAGYGILLLAGTLSPGEFELDGITLRSGGRAGLPADTAADDLKRERVHDAVLRERGVNGYRALQQMALRAIAITGPDRIAKIRPVTPHDDDMKPSLQYPMGGGGLQWKLTVGRRFLIAATVDAAGIAHAPDFSVPIGPHARYEDRARLNKYLEQVAAV